MFRKILMQAMVGDIHTCMHTQVAVQYYQCLLAGPGKKYLVYIYKYVCVHLRSTCTVYPTTKQCVEGESTGQPRGEGRNIIYHVAALAIMPVVDPWRWNDLIHGHGQSLSPAGSHRHCLTFQESEKSSLHPPTIAKIQFSTFNY